MEILGILGSDKKSTASTVTAKVQGNTLLTLSISQNVSTWWVNVGTPLKINGWNIIPWRFGSVQIILLFTWVIRRFQPLIFQGVTFRYMSHQRGSLENHQLGGGYVTALGKHSGDSGCIWSWSYFHGNLRIPPQCQPPKALLGDDGG